MCSSYTTQNYPQPQVSSFIWNGILCHNIGVFSCATTYFPPTHSIGVTYKYALVKRPLKPRMRSNPPSVLLCVFVECFTWKFLYLSSNVEFFFFNHVMFATTYFLQRLHNLRFNLNVAHGMFIDLRVHDIVVSIKKS